jgi:hypothetical protein
MTSSLLAMSVALALSLPLFVLGERLRGRQERHLTGKHTSPTKKDAP